MHIKNQNVRYNRSAQAEKYLIFIVISGLVILLDQITKLLVLARMELHQSIQVISGFFSLTHVHNPGGAFGFLASNGSILRPLVFFGAAIVALILILYFHYKTPGSYRLLGAALALVFGGAVGNLIDRFRMGVVVDFLDFYIGTYHWPAFNIADSAITIGVGVFIYHIITNKLPD